MKITRQESKHTIITIEEGSRRFTFQFQDGRMIDTKSNIPFKKSRFDWDFQQRTVKKMLSIAKADNLLSAEDQEDNIPF